MRLVDLILSMIGFIFLLPLMMIVSIVIKLTSPGPVIFSHERVGKECRKFNCYKFRSMIDGANKIGSYMTQKNDQRITPFGNFIRKYSIDELPQLINVIKGELSLVGPRPDTPKQEKLYDINDWKKRHSVRPGITGLAQISARHIATNKNRMRYDLFYINKKSMEFYFWIIAQTIKNLVKNKSY